MQTKESAEFLEWKSSLKIIEYPSGILYNIPGSPICCTNDELLTYWQQNIKTKIFTTNSILNIRDI